MNRNKLYEMSQRQADTEYENYLAWAEKKHMPKFSFSKFVEMKNKYDEIRREAQQNGVDVPSFEDCVYDVATEDVNDMFIESKQLNEASHTGRAWHGKLENINNALTAIYDKMSPADKNLKDKYFHAYYRYYNDGDYLLSANRCKALTKLGVPDAVIDTLDSRNHHYNKNGRKVSASSKSYEIGLEASVVAVMQHLLNKYKSMLGPKDRSNIYFKRKIDIAKNAIGQEYIDTYWVKKYGKEFGIDELATLAAEYETTVKSNNSAPTNQNELVQHIKQLIKKDLADHSLRESKTMRESKMLNEGKLPPNVLEFLKNNGRMAQKSAATKVAGWVEKLGKRISNGTAVGKNYGTLILDIKYQGSEIRISEEGDIKFLGVAITSGKDFVKVWNEAVAEDSLHESKTMQNKQKSAPLTESDVRVINMLKRQFILECAKIGQRPTQKEFDKMLKETFIINEERFEDDEFEQIFDHAVKTGDYSPVIKSIKEENELNGFDTACEIIAYTYAEIGSKGGKQSSFIRQLGNL